MYSVACTASKIVLKLVPSLSQHQVISVRDPPHPLRWRNLLLGRILEVGQILEIPHCWNEDHNWISCQVVRMFKHNHEDLDRGKLSERTFISLSTVREPVVESTSDLKQQWFLRLQKNVAGMDHFALRMIHSATHWLQSLEHFNAPRVSCLVLHGRSGVGKSFLARAFAGIKLSSAINL